MIFNSLDFAIFLPIVFFTYWLIGKSSNLKLQNLFLAISSCIFYGWWDWRFLILIITSITIDFLIGIALKLKDGTRNRKALLFISILVNLSLLGFFKYYNFFVENFVLAFTFFGSNLKMRTLEVILPVGISFYTFQTLSYTIDVYKRKITPTTDYISFFAFVSFFPQLVAGPIARATHLLPQFYKIRNFKYSNAIDGIRQMLWGFFKKIVIADNCAKYVDLTFSNTEVYSGSTLFFGALFFSVQIYTDFSGYSDIAIGTSRLFGFDLKKNFDFPYFSRDIAEFWRRWHISLTTWFRDYLYIPLGGSKSKPWINIRNIFIIFIISGFWHGSNWTFVTWGILNAILFLPLQIYGKNRKNIDIVAKGKLVPSFKELVKILQTFFLVSLTWIFFRSQSIEGALSYIYTMCTKTFSGKDEIVSIGLVVAILCLFIVEWIGREEEHALAYFGRELSNPYRWGMYYILIISIILMYGEEKEFIYFQF